MKIINTLMGRSVLIVLLLFALLSNSRAEGGVRGDLEAGGIDDEERPKERLLTFNDPIICPPYPVYYGGEYDPGYDCEEFDWDECEDTCYFCPCENTYFDMFGQPITVCNAKNCRGKTSICTDSCGIGSGRQWPGCCCCQECECTQVLPADHPLCRGEPTTTTTRTTTTTTTKEPIPTTTPEPRCEDSDTCGGTCPRNKECFDIRGQCKCITPCENANTESRCNAAFCEETNERCYWDGYESKCSCELPLPRCEYKQGKGCDGDCGDGQICFGLGDKKCGCAAPCDWDGEKCLGECEFGDECLEVDRKECECDTRCYYNKSTDSCDGVCEYGDGTCVPTGVGKCGCKPDCIDADPSDDCDGICPGDESGESCVFDGDEGCTCIPPCEQATVETDCLGKCPNGDECAVDGDDCVCVGLVCGDEKPVEVPGGLACEGFCPTDSGEACVPLDEDTCGCGVCEDVEPVINSEGIPVCNADCPNPAPGEACVVLGEDGNCSCGVCEDVKPVEDISGNLVCNADCPPGDGPGCVAVDRDNCACNPTCDLEITKACRVATPPPPSSGGKCKGITSLSLVWNGNGPVTVSARTSGLILQAPSTVNPGDRITLSTSGDKFKPNDQVINVVGAGGSGFSEFHMSCSDNDMNSPDDCGKLQGNGKGNDDGINFWLIASLVAESGGFQCPLPDNPDGGDDGGGSTACTVFVNNPSCDTSKPDRITLRYDGGSDSADQCGSSTIRVITDKKGKLHKDFRCSGSLDTEQSISVTPDKGGTITVEPGGDFTIELKALKELTLRNNGGGGTQSMTFHTSCSQPLQVGMTAGALRFVAFDGIGSSNEVTYSYTVTNNGLAGAKDVAIEDDPLGFIGTIESLPSGTSATLSKTVTIDRTISNTATAEGESVLDEDDSCISNRSNTVTVTVVQAPPSGGSKSKGR